MRLKEMKTLTKVTGEQINKQTKQAEEVKMGKSFSFNGDHSTRSYTDDTASGALMGLESFSRTLPRALNISGDQTGDIPLSNHSTFQQQPLLHLQSHAVMSHLCPDK